VYAYRETTPVDYQVSIDDNDPPDESFADERPTETSIAEALSSTNVSVCWDCAVTTCRQVLVAAPNVSVALVTVAIETAYLAANAPRLTASDVSVNVTAVEAVVDQSGSVAINSSTH